MIDSHHIWRGDPSYDQSDNPDETDRDDPEMAQYFKVREAHAANKTRALMADVETTDDTEPVCGESYDHDLKLIAERDGYATYECRQCGAEITSEPDDEEGWAMRTITISMDRGPCTYDRDKLETAILLRLDSPNGTGVPRQLGEIHGLNLAEATECTVAAKRCIERGIEP